MVSNIKSWTRDIWLQSVAIIPTGVDEGSQRRWDGDNLKCIKALELAEQDNWKYVGYKAEGVKGSLFGWFSALQCQSQRQTKTE